MAKENKNANELNVTQDQGFAEMNLEQLEDIKNSQWLNLEQEKALNKALGEKSGEKRDPKAIAYQATPDDDWEKEKGTPPKAEDIIEAMFNNILIYYTHKGCEWIYDQMDYRLDKHAKKRQRRLERKRALKNYSKDETFRYNKKMIGTADTLAETAVEESAKNDDFIVIAEKIREGKIDEIDSQFLSKKEKEYLKTCPQEELNKVFDPKLIKQAQKVYNNHHAAASVFAAKMAGAQMAEWRRQNLDHPKLTNKSEKELDAMFAEQKKAAYDMFIRDANNTLTNKGDPLKRGKELLQLADLALNFSTDKIKKGHYNERIDHKKKTFLGIKRNIRTFKMRGNPYLEQIKDDLKQNHDTAYQRPKDQQINLFSASEKDNRFDKLIAYTKQQHFSKVGKKQILGSVRRRVTKLKTKVNTNINSYNRYKENRKNER